MPLEMVFNELSLQTTDDIYVARDWMSTFIQTVRQATSHGMSRVIRTQSDFFDIRLASDYPLRRWLNDGDVDKETRLYMKRLATKVPFWDELPGLYESVQASEFTFDGLEAEGLGVSYLLGSLAVSLPSEARWDTARLNLAAKWLTENGAIESETVKVIHASQPGHVDEHAQWIQERRRNDVESGDDLWNRREELFPRLEFCEAAEKQVRLLSPTMFQPVIRRLFRFEIYCQRWTEGGFDPKQLGIKTTRESQATLNQYGQERTFRSPDGASRPFSWHVRLTPHAWRIHFHPEPNTRSIIIGYIGPHLRTVSDP